MRKKLAVKLFLFFTSVSLTFGQIIKPADSLSIPAAMAYMLSQEHVPKAPQTVQSPNAAGLGAYGDIPVSLYTGKPEIEIDLFSVQSGKVEIPIGLNYDASGVRPDVHPGWTGLNFGLSTQYAITRGVRDGPDEGLEGFSFEQPGYIHASVRNALNYAAPDWTSVQKLSALASALSTLDSETDEYSFSAPGLSGKFYLAHSGKFVVQCDKPVKVELIDNNLLYPPFSPPFWMPSFWNNFNNGKYRPHFTGFYLTDANGTKYEFGGGNGYTEYSIDFFRQGEDTWTCNAWYLKSITQQTGKIINFIYERGDFVAQMYFSVYNKTAQINGGNQFGCSAWSSLIGLYGPYNGKLISPIYLKEIAGDNFKVKFASSESTELRYGNDIFFTHVIADEQQYSSKVDFLTYLYDCFYPVNNNAPGTCDFSTTLATLLTKLKWRKLDKIEIQNGAGSPIKQFLLGYNNVLTERLMLQTVQEKSGDGLKSLPPYTFEYFTDPNLSLPAYCKSHTDHWGFNNGIPINTASDYNNFLNYGTNFRTCAVDAKVAKLGSLKSIKYPTGGYTKFIFEQHTFSKEVKLKRWEGEDSFANNQKAGGLRIKEVYSYDPNIPGIIKSKKYYYLTNFNPVNPDTSATTLSSGILGGKAQYYWPDYQPAPGFGNFTVKEQIFSTQSVLPASENSFGSHIGYSKVIERTEALGWSVYQFSNFENGYRDNAPSGYIQPSSTPYQPYNSFAYRRGKMLVKEEYFQNGNPSLKTNIQYGVVGNEGDYTAFATKATRTDYCNTGNYSLEGTAYIIDVRKFLPTEVIENRYDQDNPAMFCSSVSTNSYWPSGQPDVEGKSDSKGRFIKHRYKYPPNEQDAASIAMTTKHIINPVTEILKYSGLDILPTQIQLTRISHDLFSGAYLPKKVESRLWDLPTLTTDIEFLTYDPRGNVLTYKELNGPVNKLEYFGLADIGKTDLLKNKTVAEGTSISQSTSYNYKPAIGVESIQDPNGKMVFYEYDSFNRLKSVISNNAGGPKRAGYCYNLAGQVVDCAALAPTGTVSAPPLLLISEAALPVTLVEFHGVRHENAALLSWLTTHESNSDHFAIERSANGKQWETIGTVTSHGEGDEKQSYTFTDSAPLPGENLYRLKMVDRDGTFAYSRIQSVTFRDPHDAVFYPNPVSVGGRLKIRVSDPSTINRIAIFDSEGNELMSCPWQSEIDIARLTAGLYVVRITYRDGSTGVHRIAKQ